MRGAQSIGTGMIRLSQNAQKCFSCTGDATSLSQSWPGLIDRFTLFKNDDGDFPLFLQTAWNERLIVKKKRAAVLLLLCNVDGIPSILFTKRGRRLKQHAAEICFVGGHFDEGDKDLLQTALREAQEELHPQPGFIQDKVKVLGKTTSLPSLRGTMVTPFVGVLLYNLTHISLPQVFPGSPGEVDAVFTVSIRDLLRSETSIKLPPNRFQLERGPMFPTKHGEIWGLTAYILRPILRKLLNCYVHPLAHSSHE